MPGPLRATRLRTGQADWDGEGARWPCHLNSPNTRMPDWKRESRSSWKGRTARPVHPTPGEVQFVSLGEMPGDGAAREGAQTRGRYLQVQDTSDGSPGPNSKCLQNTTRAPWWHRVGSRRRRGRLRGHWVGGLLLQGPEKIAGGGGDHKEKHVKVGLLSSLKLLPGSGILHRPVGNPGDRRPRLFNSALGVLAPGWTLEGREAFTKRGGRARALARNPPSGSPSPTQSPPTRAQPRASCVCKLASQRGPRVCPQLCCFVFTKVRKFLSPF